MFRFRKPARQTVALMRRGGGMILEEPYRLFFPLGILAGIWGVLLWPLFYSGHLGFYPNEAHARVMIGGFIGAFVAGFIGTAFPRLASVRRWTAGELSALLLCWLLAVLAWLRGMVRAGDEAFAAFLFLMLAGLVIRLLRGRRDIPPPGFILVLAGLGGAAVSALWLARGPLISVELWHFAKLWLFQGFVLLPLMGIAPYLLPRFFGLPSHHSFDTSITAPEGWWPRALASMAAGLCMIATLAVEAWGWPLGGQLARAIVIVGWFAWETPAFRRPSERTTPGTVARWSIVSLAVGLACAAAWPHARIGSLHLLFVSGLGLVTMAVGARVILGHAGRHDLLEGRLVWLRWVFGLVVLAASTRMTSDFIPAVRVSHHIYAAWTWAAAAMVWLLALGKYLLRDDSEPRPAASCPRKKRRKRSAGNPSDG